MLATFYVLLAPKFTDDKQTRLERVTAKEIRQKKPPPTTTGMWIEINIEVSDAVFIHLVPKLNARVSEKALEAMLEETSELHARIVGIGDS